MEVEVGGVLEFLGAQGAVGVDHPRGGGQRDGGRGSEEGQVGGDQMEAFEVLAGVYGLRGGLGGEGEKSQDRYYNFYLNHK